MFCDVDIAFLQSFTLFGKPKEFWTTSVHLKSFSRARTVITFEKNCFSGKNVRFGRFQAKTGLLWGSLPVSGAQKKGLRRVHEVQIFFGFLKSVKLCKNAISTPQNTWKCPYRYYFWKKVVLGVKMVILGVSKPKMAFFEVACRFQVPRKRA